MNVLSIILISILLLLCFSNGSSVFPQSENGFNFLFGLCCCCYKPVIEDCQLWGLRLRLREMASSQVEIASSSPFGCVLRDHNRSRDRCSSKAKSFQKNLKELVHSCIASDNPHDSWLPEPKVVHSVDSSHDSWLPEPKVVKKSKILDRWARAREMVFPVDDNDHKAENLIPTTTTHDSNFTRGISPSQSDDSEIRNSGGVSSLVRKWRHFEADSKNLNSGNNNAGVSCLSPVSTMSNSGSTFTENPSFVNAGDSVDGKSVMSEELFFDWESDRTVLSGPPSSRGKDSDAAERERIRVADIVKKLTSDTNDREPVAGIEPLGRIRTAIEQQPHGDQQRIFPPVIGSPRLIRGRQAYSNFLIQMESEKSRELQGLAERKPVSKFSHRGRIQALLRIRFLRRESEAKSHRRSVSKTLDSNRHTIKHLRERFNTAIECGRVAESRNKEATKENTPNVENSSTSGSGSCTGSGSSAQAREMANKIPHAPKPLPPKQLTKESQLVRDSISRPCSVEAEDTTRGLKSCSSAPDFTLLKEDAKCKDVCTSTQQKTDQLKNNLETHNQEAGKVILDGIRDRNQEPADTLRKETQSVEAERDANAQQQEQEPLTIGSEHDWVKEISQAQTIWEVDDASNRQFLENCQDWISEFSQPRSEWDGQESEQQYEMNTDWISDIARPRSDWECLRQARYQEMLDPFSDNGEIRQLLERRSVSSFLSSGLRDRIDQLMISRTGGQPYPMDIQVKGQEQEQEDEEEGSVRVMEIVEEEEDAMELGVGEEHHIDEEQQPKEDEEELRSGNGERQSNEYEEEFIGQTTPSMQLNSPSSQSWSRNGDREVSDDFDQFASPSLQQSLSSSSYSRNIQQSPSSFMNHPSIEMEFIYDLRGHMEQLHQEISDLRKSIKSCVSMQVKLQRSIKQEVAAAVSQSVRREGKESLNPKKRSCLVCRKKKVDSLLYRCGHMCTCFKCAHELQWGSGKCPICQSPILDVVRTHDDR